MEQRVSPRNHVSVISVHGMTCNSCVALIEHAVSELRGINAVNVSILLEDKKYLCVHKLGVGYCRFLCRVYLLMINVATLSLL